MDRPRARNVLTAAAVAAATLTLASCSTATPATDQAHPDEPPACKMLRPVSVELGLGEPSVSGLSDRGCSSYKYRFGTLTLMLDDRPLADAATGDGTRTELQFHGKSAVMLMGALNGVCKVFLDSGEHSSIELRLGRTTAMTPQVCTDVKTAAEKVAARLPGAVS
ncbi:hypothetical protein ACFYS8_34675 [Kitasatospora sp. NPDC004615]|uniref:hypothetical protein n=1 Tax=Kitasatospora sp. NPDC004615 TaxID=3364017 RepID=UPI0036B25A6A